MVTDTEFAGFCNSFVTIFDKNETSACYT